MARLLPAEDLRKHGEGTSAEPAQLENVLGQQRTRTGDPRNQWSSARN